MLLLLLACLLALSAIVLILDNSIDDNLIVDGSNPGALDYQTQLNTIYIDGEPYTPRKGVSSMLIIGVDKEGKVAASGSYNNSERSDFLALLVFDDTSKSYTLLHLNRDTMSNIPTLDINGVRMNATIYGQLALAHTYGDGLMASCRNTVEAVSEFLYGVKIENYIAVTMSAVPAINDYIGGVAVTIEDDMTSVDPTFVKGTTVTLKGQQALSYVRARGSLEDDSNLARMARQKQYISSLVDTVSRRKVDDSFLMGALDKIIDYTVTNCSTAFLTSASHKLNSYTYSGAVSPKGDAVLGEEFMEFYVDEDDLKSILIELFYDKVEDDEQSSR